LSKLEPLFEDQEKRMPSTNQVQKALPALSDVLPERRDLFYGGAWHKPLGGYVETISPGTGESLGQVAEANREDVDAAVKAAHAGFKEWRNTKPFEKSAYMRRFADVIRNNAQEFALLDAANCGNPVTPMLKDAYDGAQYVDFFAGLTTEVKGTVTPMGPGVVNMTVHEPLGVCARILAYNHPLMFLAIKIGAPIAAGNSVIIKPPPQAPLSALRLFELAGDIFPPGVLNLVTGGLESGVALTGHPLVPSVSLVGSVPSGVAVAKTAADRLKHVGLELGGKNALIVYPDADLDKAVEGAVKGMNFLWCGQSCGSTSRLFLHDSIYDEVLPRVLEGIKRHKPGLPTDPATTMGALISKAQRDKVQRYVEIAKADGARLVMGGSIPDAPELAGGFYFEPTVFVDVKPEMRIAKEEVFGPILSVLRWSDEEAMFAAVNDVEYGLTGSIWTTSLATAHRASSRVESGYIWVNGAGPHHVSVPFGGYKMSGLGREEYIGELFHFTETKNIHITL
jgi:betaine-aldehyde dehydrogenase